MKHAQSIVDEPTGANYHNLLDGLVPASDTIGLVWQLDLSFSDDARDLRASLTKYRATMRRTDRWPGTRKYGALAEVDLFKTEVLPRQYLQLPSGLYGWRAPSLPEDLFFVRGTTLQLLSVSHERRAWLHSDLCGAPPLDEIKTETEEISDDDWGTFFSPDASACKPMRRIRRRR